MEIAELPARINVSMANNVWSHVFKVSPISCHDTAVDPSCGGGVNCRYSCAWEPFGILTLTISPSLCSQKQNVSNSLLYLKNYVQIVPCLKKKKKKFGFTKSNGKLGTVIESKKVV